MQTIDTAPEVETETASAALQAHWPEYAMEAAELGLFMVSACFFTVLLEHPASPMRPANALLRHFFEGLAMGLTLLALIFSPWGKRSGAHMNPAFTLSFYLLGKVRRWDAVFYAFAQFAGGILGVLVGYAVTITLGSLPFLGPMFKDKSGQGDIHLHISQFAVLTSTVLLQVVGLIAGLLPALKASRLDPIEALRYE